ncbi:hypothetical protein DV737_g1014, partial [Chaetothyriales sp. CBS 132003]
MAKARPTVKGVKPQHGQDTTLPTISAATRPPSFETLRSGIEAQLQGRKDGKHKKSKKSTDKKSDSQRSAHRAESAAAQGKKRSRNGDVIAASGPREVRELGGTSEDIALLADAQSDSEIEGTDEAAAPALTAKSAGNLDKGIVNILKEIKLAQRQHRWQEGQDDKSASESEQQSTEARAPAPLQTPLPPAPDSKKRKKASRLRVEPRADWYADIDSLTASATNDKLRAPPNVLAALQSHAEALLAEENEVYRQEQQSGSQQSFYNTVIASGTLSDKISALSLAVQASPIHSVKALELLIGLSKKRSRAQAVDVLRALKDLLAQGSLLPPDRRLYHFSAQPALNTACAKAKKWASGDPLPRGMEEKHVIAWAFEHWLKDRYFDILQTLEVWCNDEIEFAKSRALSYVYELLKEKAEQESNLLRLLVNKLGDPVKKIASQASYLLRELLQVHPAMKAVVVSAIETDFLFRPGQSLHGKYYATITLNQTALSSQQADLASFTRAQRQRAKAKKAAAQPQREDLQEKLISAILTGVNRAYPYAASGDNHTSFSEHLDTLFKIAHSTNFNTSIQAMLLIQQLSALHQPSSDRFYRLLYESLLDPRLIVASKQQMYLNLLHRSLKADLNSKRIKAFVKRILQILSLHEPSFICAPSHAYDAHKRAPEHANADNSCAWELIPYLAHFHPSVLVSAEKYLAHDKIPGKADLTLHTLMHFLDRFAYKNAKLSDASRLHGSSIMQPLASDNTRAVLLNPTTARKQLAAVNTEEFRARDIGHVAAEDVFFHQYFHAIGKGKSSNKAKKQNKGDREDVLSDDEDAVWDAMMNMSDLDSDTASQAGQASDAQDASEDVDVESGILDDDSSEGVPDADGHASADAPHFADLESERKKLKSLPIFASAEDYAAMIDNDEGEEIA